MANPVLVAFLVCLAFVVIVSIFVLAIALAPVGNGTGTGNGFANRTNPLSTESFFDTDLVTSGDPIPEYAGDIDTRTEITVDQLIMGAGVGGLALADQLSGAFDAAGMPVSIVVIEANKRIGGNVLSIPLKEPPGYDKSFGNLTASGFAARTQSMSLPRKRKRLTRDNVPLFFTAFMNNLILRGRNVTCQVPDQKAAQAIIDNGGEPSSSPDDIADFAFVHGDICSYDPVFVHATDGAYRNLQPDSDPLGNSDPSFNFYTYVLQGYHFGQADFFPDLATGNYDFGTDPVPHPITGELCTLGVNCPQDLCKGYDVKSFVTKIMSRSTHSNFTLRPGNPEYAALRAADGVGFFFDDEGSFDACSYFAYQGREWGNTNAVNGYALGGEMTLLNKWASRFRSVGGKIHVGERVVSINSVNSGPIKFIVHTTKRKINVRDFVFTTGSTAYLQKHSPIDRSKVWPGVLMGGDVVERLRAVLELKAQRPAQVVKTIVQWKPGVPAWFWPLLSLGGGKHSYRFFGDFGCFSRMEMIDTPEARCSNAITLEYSDYHCQKIYQAMFAKAQRTGNFTEVKASIYQFLQTQFPGMSIPLPVLVASVKTDFGWHWTGSEYSGLNNSQIFAKAAEPLPGTNIAHVAEATNPDYNGWWEGPIAAAEYVLLKHFGSRPGVGPKLHEHYEEIINIAPNGDGSINDGSLFSRYAYLPPLYTNPDPALMSPNEYWWNQFQYNSSFHASTYDYCKASKHGLHFTFD